MSERRSKDSLPQTEAPRPRVKFGEIYRGVYEPTEYYLVIEYNSDDVLTCVNLEKDNNPETRWFYHGGTMSTSELGEFVECLTLDQVLELQKRGFDKKKVPPNEELISLIKKYAAEDVGKTQIRT